MDSTIYKKIESYLMELITQNCNIPDYKLPSERTLSSSFDASRKPVRHAYDNLMKKGYVINIHGKGYFINSQAFLEKSAVNSRSNPKIALIIPSISTQFDHNILSGIHSFCSNHQIEFTIHISDCSADKEDFLLRSIPLSGTKGIILFPVDHETAYHNELLKLSIRKYPLVLIDRMVPNIHASFISSNNNEAMINAVEFLKKKHFHNIVYITPPSEVASTIVTRINGFTHALLRHYKIATPQNILMIDGTPAQKKSTIVKHLKDYPNTEIIIVASVQRHCVLSAIQELGLNIPRDIKLMFFDEELTVTERNTLKPYILQQDGYQVGYLAAEALYNQLYGDMRPVTKLLPVTIIDTSLEHT